MQLEADTKIIPPRGADDTHTPAAVRATSEPQVLQRWVGRYELIHRLAHGGMATVYLGRAKGKAGFEKVVAVKIIHPHLASEEEFVGMFLDEARIAARIHHPHVVEILDLGEHDGVYYMVMEFIEGENLAALIRALDGELLPIPVILQIMADTLEGLAAAHGLRDADEQPYELVHRDVSPHNILINLDGWAKVADFGIMKAAGKASNTKTGELRGKLAYMSPEQARGDTTVDRRTDLFALCVIVWELLTGKRLFACTTEAATLEKVMACTVPPLGSVRPQLRDHPRLREGLEALLARGLAPDPSSRHANANAMLTEIKALRRLVDDLPANEANPRAHLGSLIQRFFQRRVDYARAALRRTGEYEALMASGLDWPRVPLPTGEFPNVDTGTPLGVLRPPTGSQPSFVHGVRPDTATHSSLTPPNRLAQWSMWLLLPMLGAGIAIVAMLWLGPRFAERRAPDPTPQGTSAATTTDADKAEPPGNGDANPEELRRLAPSELAAAQYAPIPQKPPGTIRWWFSSTPSGAQLYIGGESHGVTPTFVHVPLGEQPVDVRLELAGYESQNLALLPSNDQNFSQQLQLAPVTTKPAGTKVSSKRKSVKANEPKPADPGGEDPKADSKKAFVPVPDSLRE